jgi:hypothetical protein
MVARNKNVHENFCGKEILRENKTWQNNFAKAFLQNKNFLENFFRARIFRENFLEEEISRKFAYFSLFLDFCEKEKNTSRFNPMRTRTPQ